ncbi:hypothetical protein QQP08_007334 [Theobroma cacao]|nr:hypothetical protein QQP08_007334 [Theobroma cacao]
MPQHPQQCSFAQVFEIQMRQINTRFLLRTEGFYMGLKKWEVMFQEHLDKDVASKLICDDFAIIIKPSMNNIFSHCIPISLPSKCRTQGGDPVLPKAAIW